MSRTPDIGVVGVKYWAYMATVMESCLDIIVKGYETKIPAGVFSDALLFFKVVLERETGTHFDNPLARINAHIIAWEVLNDCAALQSHTSCVTLEEANGHFRRFAEFLESLEKQPTVPLGEGFAKQPLVPLGTEDQKTATDLRDFFTALLRKDAGEGRD